MEWQLIVALVLGIPAALVPAAFVWYLTLGGLAKGLRRERRVGAVAGKAEALATA